MEGVGLVIKGVSSVKEAAASVFFPSQDNMRSFCLLERSFLDCSVPLGEEKMKAQVISELFVITKEPFVPRAFVLCVPFFYTNFV